MAKLTRKRQKIFGSDATNNGVFGSAQLGTKLTSTDIDTIQSLTAWLNGWQDAVISGRLPTLEEAQSIHYVSTYNIAYLMQEGIPEWSATTEYHIGSIVKKTGTFEIYGSKVNDNLNIALPDKASTGDWDYLGDLARLLSTTGTIADNEILIADGTDGKLAQGSGFIAPASDGTAGQSLITDGSGNLSFGTIINSYVSSPTAFVNGTAVSFTHGLGAEPDLTFVELVCETAEGGFATGDVIKLVGSYCESDGANLTGSVVYVNTGNTTSVEVRISSNGIRMTGKTTGTGFIITPANWRLRVRAYKFN